MADPLSVAASIAGLLLLPEPILARGYAYIVSIRNSPNVLKQLLSEISTLEAILGQIDELAFDANNTNTIKATSNLLKSVQSSIKLFEQIPRQGAKNIGRVIIWLFKEWEVKENLDQFKGLINTFELALSIESK
ncbi:hypothetical protein BGX38DRAFT_1274767 [Terfezia claveryi]|nr:hypothetical protein BGX38DRAFT_1274767 [Terfezia claveryi]